MCKHGEINPLQIRLFIDNHVINEFNIYHTFIPALNEAPPPFRNVLQVENEVKTNKWEKIHLFVHITTV